MQIKIFTIPALGGEAINEDLNAFLRTKKILQIEQELVHCAQSAVWSFCIRYIEDYSPIIKEKDKIDYKEVLGEEAFGRFAAMRETRKRIAKEEGLPAYAIFKDEELAKMAEHQDLTLANMKSIKGIGPKKLETYGQHFVKSSPDEKG